MSDERRISEMIDEALAKHEHHMRIDYDRDKALTWIRKAASLGSLKAQLQLAFHLHREQGAEREFLRLAFRLVATGESPYVMEAAHMLSSHYPGGSASAMSWSELAAENGSVTSVGNLARHYAESGDAEKSYYWSRIGESLMAPGTIARDELAGISHRSQKHLDSDQRERLNQLVSKFLEKAKCWPPVLD